MANVLVDYQELTVTAGRLSTGQQEVEQQLMSLKAAVDQLVASGFVTDQASGRFQQSYQQWTTGAKNVMAGLEGMSGFLRKAIADHQQLDSGLAQSAG